MLSSTAPFRCGRRSRAITDGWPHTPQQLHRLEVHESRGLQMDTRGWCPTRAPNAATQAEVRQPQAVIEHPQARGQTKGSCQP